MGLCFVPGTSILSRRGCEGQGRAWERPARRQVSRSPERGSRPLHRPLLRGSEEALGGGRARLTHVSAPPSPLMSRRSSPGTGGRGPLPAPAASSRQSGSWQGSPGTSKAENRPGPASGRRLPGANGAEIKVGHPLVPGSMGCSAAWKARAGRARGGPSDGGCPAPAPLGSPEPASWQGRAE